MTMPEPLPPRIQLVNFTLSNNARDEIERLRARYLRLEPENPPTVLYFQADRRYKLGDPSSGGVIAGFFSAKATC